MHSANMAATQTTDSVRVCETEELFSWETWALSSSVSV